MEGIKKIPGRIAAINDLSGFGRCSLSLMMPVISACGYQCCPVPTAVLSSTNDIAVPFQRELTEDMEPYMKQWKKLNLHFDGIYSGYFSSPEQMALASRFMELFLEENTVLLVDPVMGDHGYISPRCSEKFVQGYYDLIRHAHIITPNLTEALYLTGIPYQAEPEEKTIDTAAQRLLQAGPAHVVITGIRKGNECRTYVYGEQGKQVVSAAYCPQERTGTGDMFASILLSKYLDGMELQAAVQQAASFISDTLACTAELGVPVSEGICFEPYLCRLSPYRNQI